MLDALIILSFVFAGAGIGFYSSDFLPDSALQQVSNLDGLRWVISGFGALLGGVSGIAMQVTYRRVEQNIRQMPLESLLTRSVGLMLGLVVVNLMLAPLFLVPIPKDFSFIKPLIAIMGSVMFAFLGVALADTHGRAFLRLINPNSIESLMVAEGTLRPAQAKLVDTSCIIDGRIASLIQTGFLEGPILIPQFVLAELQQVADSSNDRKRVRGRRGLDILNQMQDDFPDRIKIHPADYEDLSEVDTKLVRLASEINAMLLTNDFNLSKVATLQKVTVLNVNDLAQAVRLSYVPGDSLELKIVKPGKEASQGVGYLDDGTMVVVEEASEEVGSEVRAIVTSALQTSAGRMIFAKLPTSVMA
ncbi:MAG: PIN/TRAM domain-containing protein [Geitlerinemataceae cyanobacterium]